MLESVNVRRRGVLEQGVREGEGWLPEDRVR